MSVKRFEIQNYANKIGDTIFPDFLYIINSKYDIYFQKKIKLIDVDKSFNEVINSIKFENYSDMQLIFLFNIMDKKCDSFLTKNWFEFSHLTSIFCKNDNIRVPDEISYIKEEKYLLLVKESIDEKRNIISLRYNKLKKHFLSDLNSKNDLEVNIKNETVNSIKPKLKTNLSVSELALLFKLLKDLKPNLFEVKSEAELHRFISANFETKKTGENDISTNKLRILFNQPENKAVEFWEEKLRLMLADVKKLK